MKEMTKFVVCLLGMATMLIGASCTNEEKEVESRSVPKAQVIKPDDPERYAQYSFDFSCTPTESSFEHEGKSMIEVYIKGTDTPEYTMERKLKSNCAISCNPDTIRVSDGYTVNQQNVSIARKRFGSVERDTIRISVSDGRTLVLPYSAEYYSDMYMGLAYQHGHDSLISARLVNVENRPIIVDASAEEGKYIKAAYKTTYSVEVGTTAYKGDGSVADSHNDVLKTTGITLVLANNGTTTREGDYGVVILNENQQKDSVVIITTWDDGHTEISTNSTILHRWLKNVERREVIVSSFDSRSAETSFTKEVKAESLVREDELWSVYGREVVLKKMVTVNGHSEEVSYTYYQERAEFHSKDAGISRDFDYIDWDVQNYADDFKTAVSTKNGYDMLSYTNEIRTNYAGFVQMSSEAIDWFKEQVKITGYGISIADRKDYTTYTHVSLTKVAYKSDGSQETVGTFEANLPIVVNPLTNWVINADVWGVYTSGNFVKNQTSKKSDVAEKFFSFNRYGYNFSNEVSGQKNAFEVSVPNDIVFNDGDVEYTFANTELSTSKKSENTNLLAEDDTKSTYSYACIASVIFGVAQEVTLPGTIYLAKNNPGPNPDPEPEPDPVVHTHGKVVATYFTSTPTENRNSWYNVCVIQFEDGYRSVGMANNEETEFNFTMASAKDNVNSAVYYGGAWHPGTAIDNHSASCMVWYDENGKARRSLDYVSATAMRWNNGHNTVVDVRREGKISEDGYSVTLYLNGLAGQTLNF